MRTCSSCMQLFLLKTMMDDHLYSKDIHKPISYKDNSEGKSDKD